MKKNVAIFIDWDNYRKELEAVTKQVQNSVGKFNFNNISQLMKSIKYFLDTMRKNYIGFLYIQPRH